MLYSYAILGSNIEYYDDARLEKQTTSDPKWPPYARITQIWRLWHGKLAASGATNLTMELGSLYRRERGQTITCEKSSDCAVNQRVVLTPKWREKPSSIGRDRNYLIARTWGSLSAASRIDPRRPGSDEIAVLREPVSHQLKFIRGAPFRTHVIMSGSGSPKWKS